MAEQDVVVSPDIDDEGFSKDGDQWVKTIDTGDGKTSTFKGATKRDVNKQVEESFRNASARIRQQERQIKLGQGLLKPDPAREIPEFKPRDLTPQQRASIAAQLTTPAGTEKAFDTLIEAKFGAPVETVRTALNSIYQNEERQRLQKEADAFAAAHPDVALNAENETTLIAYLKKHDMGWTANNLEIAYSDLKDSGILILQEPAKSEVKPQPQEKAAPNAPQNPPRGVPRSTSTALSERDSSAPRGSRTVTAPPSGPSYEALEAMSADEFERWSSNPTNQKYYEQLMASRRQGQR